MEAVQTSEGVNDNARRQLQKAVMALSKALRQAMEMVEIIEMGDRNRIPKEETPRAKGMRGTLRSWKEKVDKRMIAINIVRLVCITLELTVPIFSTAWLIFRLSGFYMADQMESYARSIEEKKSCCVIV